MPQDSLLGLQLDEYRLEMLLGSGGMARVYRGLDTRLGRYAAIKVIDAPFRTASEYVMRFEREAQAIAKLEHPHIVRLYRYGEAQGVLYMAMQYIEGSDLGFVLRSYNEDQEFIEPEEALRITREVCSALDFAHSKGVIHRDVKPSNIMLDKQGQAYLTDFGLALLTEVGTRGEIFGSPHYIAPEQAISSAGAVPQSDLYAMGIILYEMFTGQYPFDAETPMDIAMKHMSEPPPPPRDIRPEIAPELEAMILKAIAKEPEQRYPTGTALVAAMEHALARSQTPPPTRTTTTLSRKSIPDRVAIDFAANPLPPIPGEVAPPDAALAPTRSLSAPPRVVTEPVGTQQPRSRVPIYAGSLVVVLLAIVMVALVLLLGRNKGNDSSTGFSQADDGTHPAAISDVTEIAQLSASETQRAALAVVPAQTVVAATAVASTATSIPTITPFPTFTYTLVPTSTMIPTRTPTATFTVTHAPTLTPLPTLTLGPTLTPIPPTAVALAAVETQESYSLLIAKRGQDSLFVINQGKRNFPLGSLVLGEGEGRIAGSEWGLTVLSPGACVTVWKDDKKPKAPDVACTEVGRHLTRDKKERFWKSAFDIYFAGAWVANCASNQCSINIAGGAPPAITATSFELLITKKGQDSLFVVNQGTSGFPLSSLRLGEGQGSISGAEWGLAVLQPGQCVAAWKNNGKPKSPDVDCDLVGARVTRDGPQRFWKSSFEVFYGQQVELTCGSDRCPIRIPR